MEIKKKEVRKGQTEGCWAEFECGKCIDKNAEGNSQRKRMEGFFPAKGK